MYYECVVLLIELFWFSWLFQWLLGVKVNCFEGIVKMICYIFGIFVVSGLFVVFFLIFQLVWCYIGCVLEVFEYWCDGSFLGQIVVRQYYVFLIYCFIFNRFWLFFYIYLFFFYLLDFECVFIFVYDND